MKLPRPYIPLEVRVLVAERQVREIRPDYEPLQASKWVRLQSMIAILREPHGKKLELHHRPALLNRQQVKIAGVIVGYLPDANDHRYLVYLPEDEHDIETRVRGLGAQLSDLAQARKNRKITRRLAGKPKRKTRLRSANRWPPKGSRRVNWRNDSRN